MIKEIVAIFLMWRIGLFLIAFLAISLFPQFGGSFPYYNQVLKITNLPQWIWSFGNFDGVHYLRIAQNGYDAQYSQAFFPLYPLLIHILASFFPKNEILDTGIYVDPAFFYSGFLISNIFFLFTLIIFYKLIRSEFNNKIAYSSLILLISFPTSFYFGSIYSESLFLFLVLSTIFFIRKNNFLLAGFFCALASATRIFGLFLIPVLLFEYYLKLKKREVTKTEELAKMIFSLLIAPLGILLYMLYLKLYFNNPLFFFTSQPSFGAERTHENLIFLPQVLFRYVKIFLSVPIQSQLFFNAVTEFLFSVSAIMLTIILFRRMRFSYFIFTLGSLILPTLTGTLSSMPRYSLMGFLLLPLIFQMCGRYYKLWVFFLLVISIIMVSLFVRGFWVA